MHLSRAAIRKHLTSFSGVNLFACSHRPFSRRKIPLTQSNCCHYLPGLRSKTEKNPRWRRKRVLRRGTVSVRTPSWKKKKQWAANCSWKTRGTEGERIDPEGETDPEEFYPEEDELAEGSFWRNNEGATFLYSVCPSGCARCSISGLHLIDVNHKGTCPPSRTSEKYSKCSDNFSRCQALSFKDG